MMSFYYIIIIKSLMRRDIHLSHGDCFKGGDCTALKIQVRAYIYICIGRSSNNDNEEVAP